jgi:hypothetical protein
MNTSLQFQRVAGVWHAFVWDAVRIDVRLSIHIASRRSLRGLTNSTIDDLVPRDRTMVRLLAWDGILGDMGTHPPIERPREARTELDHRIRPGNAPARPHPSARILLLSDRSQGPQRTNQEGADAVGCCTTTVRTVRRRCRSGRWEAALSDTGWSGAPPTCTGDGDATVGMVACREPPAGAARRTVRLLADTMGNLPAVDAMSHGTVGAIRKHTTSRRGAYRPGAFARRLGWMVPRWTTGELALSALMPPRARSDAWMQPAQRCMTFPAGGCCLSSRVSRDGRTTHTNGMEVPIAC